MSIGWFDIRLDSRATRQADWELGAYPGQIELDEFVEEFAASATLWTAEEYRRQWTGAITRLIYENQPSALITSVDDPARSGILFWWLLYPAQPLVHVRHAILFFEDLETPFDLRDPFRSIPVRSLQSAEGGAIAEWSLPASAFANFLERTSAR